MIEPYKKKSLNRLKRIQGQINGIIKLIEGDAYCGDIMQQMLAASGALKAASSHVLESHLHTCAKKGLSSKDEKKREAFIQELVRAFKLSQK